jgi:plasmid stabilization system protein ParE
VIRVVVAPEARDDLKQIWRYLAQEVGVPVADRIREKLLASFTMLARHPGIGHKREDPTALKVLFSIVSINTWSSIPTTPRHFGYLASSTESATSQL